MEYNQTENGKEYMRYPISLNPCSNGIQSNLLEAGKVSEEE